MHYHPQNSILEDKRNKVKEKRKEKKTIRSINFNIDYSLSKFNSPRKTSLSMNCV
jgi:hypothetical protein